MSGLTSFCWTSKFAYRLLDVWSLEGVVWDHQTRLTLHGMGVPIVSMIGIIGNTLSIPVLSRLVQRKKCPFFHLLLALAIADLLVTGCYLVDSAVCDNDEVKDYGFPYYDGTGGNGSSFDALIYGLPPVTNIFSFASNWCTVTVAAFRFIAVISPLRASNWCSVRRARVAILSIYVTATVATVLPFLFNISEFRLQISNDLHYKVSFLIVYRTLSDLLPWAISIVLGSLLIASLRRQQALILSSCQQQRKILEKQKRITILLISTAVWFVMLNVPLVVASCIYVIPIVFSQDVRADDVLLTLYNFIKFTTVVSYAGNFFLYCCVNESYRKQIRKLISACMMQKCCQRNTRGMPKIASQDSGTHLVPEGGRTTVEQAI